MVDALVLLFFVACSFFRDMVRREVHVPPRVGILHARGEIENRKSRRQSKVHDTDRSQYYSYVPAVLLKLVAKYDGDIDIGIP